MARQIVWSRQAVEDLREIVLFITQDNPERAESFAVGLVGKTEHLEKYPEFGRAVPEFADHCVREVIHRPYRIIYQILLKGNIAILRLWHGARGIPELMGE